MKKLDKFRKGVIWALMAEEERDLIIESWRNGLTITVYSQTLKDFKIIDMSKEAFRSDRCYWIKEWDEPDGDELVGKWCILSSDLENHILLGKVSNYNHSDYNKFESYGRKFKSAKLATIENVKKYIPELFNQLYHVKEERC